uniref:F-box protein 43 n=1 Tax=Salmo trutta TaxID=8032 RepID=A0A674AR59_SALTR
MKQCLRPDVNFHKDQQYGACQDSGYLDSGYSSKIEFGDDFNLSKCCSSDGFHETPKENVSQKCEPLSPRKNRQKEDVRSPQRDILKEQPLQNGWCETPKVSRREPMLRRRLLMSKSATEDSSANGTPEHCSNVVFDSPDAFTIGALATSTLKPEDALLSGRKLRLLFSLVKTSTLEDGKCNVTNVTLFERKAFATSIIPSVKDDFQTPVNNSVADSGFSSLALDKSQDSTLDNDGSFQEMLLSSSGSSRSRLERQRRLSTLREGGSQSEGDRDVRNLAAHRDDDSDVFLDVTPPKTTTAKLEDLSFTPALQMVQAMSQRTSRMLLEHTSLEELLRVSEKEAFRTDMPLAGLIGRKMGFYTLPPEIQGYFHQHCSFPVCVQLGSAVHVPDAETRLTLLSRSVLKSVQAQSRTPNTSIRGTPQSGTVAKTLFTDECLKPCPRCRHPARCHSVKMEGVCSSVDCGFQFCTSCRCAFHGSRECASLSAKRRSKKDVLPGSAQSKRNVRRL